MAVSVGGRKWMKKHFCTNGAVARKLLSRPSVYCSLSQSIFCYIMHQADPYPADSAPGAFVGPSPRACDWAAGLTAPLDQPLLSLLRWVDSPRPLGPWWCFRSWWGRKRRNCRQTKADDSVREAHLPT